MTERQTSRRNPRGTTATDPAAERERQEALKAEKIARGSAAPVVTEVVGEPVDSSFLPDAPSPPPKKRAPRKPKPEPVAAATDDAKDTAEADKAALAAPYAHLAATSPAAERHAAVKALAETGKFTYVEIARLTHYANGGVVRNIVIPPERNRSKYEPLADDALAQVRALEQALGMSVREIAKRTPKAES